MGCTSCASGKNGNPTGCGDKGHCATGGCNRLNTYDWIAMLDIYDPSGFDVVEVSFKQGARKDFFRIPPHIQPQHGEYLVVDVGNGFDIGRLSLSGELVRIQMKKKNYHEDKVVNKVIRIANERDLERLNEARDLEKPALVKSRAIARTLGLEMKVGDVEYRGDKRKATFYYTADGRVDFRELVRNYAREFRIKIEMRQIGARQESGRIGGIGSCGRELCCSTWLTDFKSVTTSAARYQNLSINQAKLSGQCGRLKCCLNYELDTYLDALRDFPDHADMLITERGKAVLIKTDIFKKLMYYAFETDRGRSNVNAVPVSRVMEILKLNARGEHPEVLLIPDMIDPETGDGSGSDYEDVTGFIELPPEKKKRRRGKNRKRDKSSKGSTPKDSNRKDKGKNTKRKDKQ